MFAFRRVLSITTASDGTATVLDTESVTGRLIAALYVPDATNLDNAAALTLTAENADGGKQTLLNGATVTAGATAQQWAPRQPTHKNDGTAALYAASGLAVNDHYMLAGDQLKLVVASGGNAKKGKLVLILG